MLWGKKKLTWKILTHGTTKNLNRDLDHKLGKLQKWQGERKHYIYPGQKMTILFSTGKTRPTLRVPVPTDEDILPFFLNPTSVPRGISVTFTSFSVSTRSGSFSPSFLGGLPNVPVQHTATLRLLISALVLKSEPAGIPLLQAGPMGWWQPPGAEWPGEGCSTRRTQAGKKSEYGRGLENQSSEELWERMMQNQTAFCFGGDQWKETDKQWS